VGETDIASTRAGGCDDPFEQRVRESSLDLGTAFDCFSEAQRASPSVSAQARVNRDRLRRALEAEGFCNYARDRLAPNQAYDFPVR
jgi:D-alanyl-D-alanine dipeptidase